MLYKRMPTGVHLRCVDQNEAQKLIEAVHKGVCGIHMNRTVLGTGLFLVDYGNRLC